MPTSLRSLRHELPDIHTWRELQALYKDIHFDTPRYERVEEYGVKTHRLHERLPHLQTFWRYHVAPATHRPFNTHLAADVAEVTTRIAQRSYEVYANICDALDELDLMNEQPPKPPRYRSCLNVLRCVGDACQLFDDLVDVLGNKKGPFRQRRPNGPRNLARLLGVDIFFFRDWDQPQWSTARMHIADYRHMLVHHGRPWLFFNGDEFVGEPLVLMARHCRVPGSDPKEPEYLTWSQQRKMFGTDPSNFIELRKASERTCNAGITWLNRAYERLVLTLDGVLSNRDNFDQYKGYWGVS
jgi:hypothetical protein